ncbi:acyl-protein thioesterase 1-like [Convolutriloba macropyga]|uniref:acyl-protein thioesterase 1-like n=1 Tax=Convolutriloba macropyga TaxID=536237 RepID=UPI003F52299D
MDSPVIKPTAEHKGTVIFLHGLGDTGHGWSAGFETIREPNLKYIFPTATVKPVSLNGGFPMPSWFDIISLDNSGKEDELGIKRAAGDLLDMVDKEAASSNLPLSKIMIGGFSQGGATALYAAATSQKQLGGVIALSSWLPLHKTVDAGDIPHRGVPVLQCHGDSDPLVTYTFGDMSHKLLVKKGMSNYTFKSYPGMTHGSSAQEMRDVKDFIKTILL